MSTQTNFDLVLFGATGDLAMRKLLPCLYQAHVAGLLHPEGRILGVSRSELDTAGFLAKVETNSKIQCQTKLLRRSVGIVYPTSRVFESRCDKERRLHCFGRLGKSAQEY